MSTVSYQQDVETLIGQLKGMFPEDKFAVFNHDAQQLAAAHTSPLVAKPGDRARDFSLPNAHGNQVRLQALIEQGPLVLTFYRGVWCPYCNLYLKLLQQILPQIKQAGGSMVAISPMNPDNSKATIETSELEFEVLSDIGNKVARQYTRVFKNADEPIKAMSELGYDFYSFYDDKAPELPVSATFIIAPDGIIKFAESEGGDYRKRTEPEKILDILKTMK
ncbi:AhpC/Tsa family protein GSU0066 [hydrothermal vent metagenome]|uniref:thioredoxin-dependent peroxiredoxin n=1 Tax=hydrothermal vent metagenome TaxID=652676 RepID=A0A3B0YAS7_9ZZZZ